MGVQTVMDLMNNSEKVPSLQLPPIMETQVEALLSVAIGTATQAKVVPTVRDHVESAPDMFTVPMLYDNKFQRGPFDPYGVPPRFIPPTALKSKKDDKVGTGSGRMKGEGAGAPTKVKKPDMGTISPIKKSEDSHEENGYKSSEDEDDNENLDGSELDGMGLFSAKSKSPIKGMAKLNTESLYALQVADTFKNKEEKEADAKFRAELAKAQTDADFAAENDEYALLEKQQSQQRNDTAAKRARLLMHDFESRVRAGFERPFKCRHKGCDEAFSRAYTLKIHEKSHKLFGDYHRWKKDPQLFLDKDKNAMVQTAHELKESRSLLPPIVQADLQDLRDSAAAKAFDLAFNDGDSEENSSTMTSKKVQMDLYRKLRELGVNPEIEERKLKLQLSASQWPQGKPHSQAPALKAYKALNENYGDESCALDPDVYERPYTQSGDKPTNEWGEGRNEHKKGSRVSLSRGNSSHSTRASSPMSRNGSPVSRSLHSRDKFTSRSTVTKLDTLRHLHVEVEQLEQTSTDANEKKSIGTYLTGNETYMKKLKDSAESIGANYLSGNRPISSSSKPSNSLSRPNSVQTINEEGDSTTIRFGTGFNDDEDCENDGSNDYTVSDENTSVDPFSEELF
jgi:hypothetical protein